MDLLIELFLKLWESMNPKEFAVVAVLLAASTYGLTNLVLHARKKSKKLRFFLGGKTEADEKEEMLKADWKALKVILDELKTLNVSNHSTLSAALSALSELSSGHHKQAVASFADILTALIESRADEKFRSESTIKHLTELQVLLGLSKADLERQIESLKQQLTIHDIQEHQLFDAHKSSLADTLELINDVHTQIEKIDEYVRAAVPEFKQAHRDLSKDLSNLSRDIALVERSIQTQMLNPAGTVKLR